MFTVAQVFSRTVSMAHQTTALEIPTSQRQQEATSMVFEIIVFCFDLFKYVGEIDMVQLVQFGITDKVFRLIDYLVERSGKTRD